ncbi:HK97 gp10 family phage protein [Sutcliffiella horikoshii]|uniref:HK97 gp10 family phage protein n=1 Tax=Sutcliffiella horikoshii TaxID=79883 RepID=A0A5D4TI86_9BACI|nr:HK97 gp10 family phage protein [Sutcliffiella horikoshii]TYS74518.1 HK97 gp10 family phage protein [Sutcliffiella horikoshii]
MPKIDLSKEIAKILAEYTTEVTEGLEKAKEETAKETVTHLKSGREPKLTGDYLAGWASKKVGTTQVVHNKTDYQLTHLLEKGHVNRDGSRTKAIPHIKPAEEEAIKEYLKKVEKVIKG